VNEEVKAERWAEPIATAATALCGMNSRSALCALGAAEESKDSPLESFDVRTTRLLALLYS